MIRVHRHLDATEEYRNDSMSTSPAAVDRVGDARVVENSYAEA